MYSLDLIGLQRHLNKNSIFFIGCKTPTNQKRFYVHHTFSWIHALYKCINLNILLSIKSEIVNQKRACTRFMFNCIVMSSFLLLFRHGIMVSITDMQQKVLNKAHLRCKMWYYATGYTKYMITVLRYKR